jgi:hypothetical protein
MSWKNASCRFPVRSGWRGGGQADRPALGSATAIFGEVGNEAVHRAKIGGVEKLPAQAALRDQAGAVKVLQMEGE